MKFLFLITAKPNVPPGPDVFLKHKEWVQGLEKSGVFESAYVFAGTMDGMCIVNVESLEQLNDIRMAARPGHSPMWRFDR